MSQKMSEDEKRSHREEISHMIDNMQSGITGLRYNSGCSAADIENFLMNEYRVPEEVCRTSIQRCLRRVVAAGLVHEQGGFYRIGVLTPVIKKALVRKTAKCGLRREKKIKRLNRQRRH